MRWKHPWTIVCGLIICGPIDCGKTIFVKILFLFIYLSYPTRFERVLFYYAEWQEASSIIVNYNTTHVKEFEEQRWQCSNKMTKKNIISRGKITTSERLFERSSFSEINDNRRSYERIVAVRSWIFLPKAVITRISVLFLSHRIYSIRDQRDISLNANYIVVLKNPRDRAQIRYLVRQVYLDDPKFLEEAYYDANLISGVFVARSETINPRRVSISNMYFSRGYDSLCLRAA